jgi:hypothetical protein
MVLQGNGWLSALGTSVIRSTAFHLWDCDFDFHTRLFIWKESVKLLPKVVGFLRLVRPVSSPPPKKNNLIGWVSVYIEIDSWPRRDEISEMN